MTGPIFAFLLLHLHEGGPAGWRPVEGGFCSEFVGEKPPVTPVQLYIICLVNEGALAPDAGGLADTAAVELHANAKVLITLV